MSRMGMMGMGEMFAQGPGTSSMMPTGMGPNMPMGMGSTPDTMNLPDEKTGKRRKMARTKKKSPGKSMKRMKK